MRSSAGGFVPAARRIFYLRKDGYDKRMQRRTSMSYSARRSVLFSKQDHGRGIPLCPGIFFVFVVGRHDVRTVCGRGAAFVRNDRRIRYLRAEKCGDIRNIKYFRVQNSNRAFNALRSNASVVIIKI